LVPEVLDPVKLMTVIDAASLADSVAVTVTLLSLAVAKARQISAVPAWALVLCTRVQVKLPPEMLLIDTFVPLEAASVEMNASSNSFVEEVENADDAIVLELVERSVEVVTSIAIDAVAAFVRLKPAVAVTPETLAVTV
jgi:hypothetical protein